MISRNRALGLLAALLLGTASWVSSGQQIGGVSHCRQQPAFSKGLPKGSVIGTSFPGVTGLAIAVPQPDGRSWRMLHRNGWDSAGMLGQFTYDEKGNFYVVPVPLTSLELNPLEDQNKVYRMDTDTGALEAFIDLPASKPLTTQNPFGTIGITYDCESRSLYVASLAGSGPMEELGSLFRINLASGEVVDRMDGKDMLGLGIYRTATGKRLYFGLARKGEVHSVALDDKGDFLDESRFEFGLGLVDEGGNHRAQRITFNRDGEMLLKVLPFNYNLRSSGQAEHVTHRLRYVAAEDLWEPVR